MKLWKFDNYEEYKEAQIIGYEAKVNTHSWVDTHAIRGLVSYIVDYNSGRDENSFLDFLKENEKKKVKKPSRTKSRTRTKNKAPKRKTSRRGSRKQK